MPLSSPLDTVAASTAADPVLHRLASAVERLPLAVLEALRGGWLGHPLHPVLAQAPVGAWLSAAVLDGVAALSPPGPARDGAERSAATLVAAGLLAAPVTALAGAADWSRLTPEQQRVGAVHAATNSVATVLLVASLRQRRRGRAVSGRVLGMLGVGVAGVSAGIGGDLAYRFAAGLRDPDGGHPGPRPGRRLGEVVQEATGNRHLARSRRDHHRPGTPSGA